MTQSRKKGLVVLVAGLATGYATSSFLGSSLYDRLGLLGSGIAIGAIIYAVARSIEYLLDRRYPEQGR
jgi:hypothetical protein